MQKELILKRAKGINAFNLVVKPYLSGLKAIEPYYVMLLPAAGKE